MTARKKPPPLADRLAAFSLALRMVVDEARREFRDADGMFTVYPEVEAACIIAASELVRGADLGNDPRTA